jgi:hypothetical protein
MFLERRGRGTAVCLAESWEVDGGSCDMWKQGTGLRDSILSASGVVIADIVASPDVVTQAEITRHGRDG